MRDTGIVRHIDELGRIVIPSELRRAFGLVAHDAIQFFVEGERIVLQKSDEQCVFCGKLRHLETFHDRLVCAVCRAELAARAPGSGSGDRRRQDRRQ